jgi:uncharacterized protein (TIGR02231 family)
MTTYSVLSAVAAVTVYPDRARVTVSGQVEVTPGIHQLLFEELPLVLDPASIRAGGKGTAQVRLLGVDLNRAHYEETPAEKVRQLEEQIERLQDELRVLADQKEGLAAQAAYLAGLRQATAEYARGLSRGKTTVEDQARLTAFLGERDGEIRASLRQITQQERGLQRRLDKLLRELKDLQTARPRQRYRAKIEVEVLSDGVFKPELSYVVTQAGWRPLYDLRLHEENGDSGAPGRQLEVSYLAHVQQNTGQDWPAVELTVSTARPALNQRLPELHPWYLDFYTPSPPVAPSPAPRVDRVAGAPAQMMKAASAMAMEEAVPEVAAEVAMGQVQDRGTSVSFRIPGQTDIPSDGSPHKTTINRFSLDASLDYLAVPKHTDAVFRRVTVHNTGPSPLLMGQASLFAGDEFIGSNQLEYAAVDQEIELLFGVEERLTVERELSRRDVDKALLRDKRQLRYGYRIEVHNLLAREVQIEVHDQLPVARHEEIKIKLEHMSPEPAERSDLNLMEWHLTLPPSGRQVIAYEFLVEHPRDKRIVGLID